MQRLVSIILVIVILSLSLTSCALLDLFKKPEKPVELNIIDDKYRNSSFALHDATAFLLVCFSKQCRKLFFLQLHTDYADLSGNACTAAAYILLFGYVVKIQPIISRIDHTLGTKYGTVRAAVQRRENVRKLFGGILFDCLHTP